MKYTSLIALGSLTTFLLAWFGPTSEQVRAEPRSDSFRELTLHIEVDLPSPFGPDRHLLRPESLILLPAEVVIQAKAGEALRQVRLFDALGSTAFDIACPSATALAVTELMVECDGVTLGQAFGEYPAGLYHVEGRTMSGALVRGSVRLDHRFPGLFAVVRPRPGEVVAVEDATLTWTPSERAVRYLLEIEQDASGFSFELALPAGQTSFTVPQALLRPGECYEYSLSVEGDTDNELEVEGAFWTAAAVR